MSFRPSAISPSNTPSRTALLLCLLPIAVVAVCIRLFGINIPFVDQFGVVALLQRRQLGLLTLSDLFAQNNENRPFFPRLIWLGLAGLSHYDVRLELWVNLAIAIGTFAFFAIHAMRIWRQYGAPVPALLLTLMSFLVFNLGQWESWLQGFQTVMFLGSACVVTGLLLLSGPPTWTRWILAVCVGIVGSFSTPNALLFWPIGLALVLLTSPANLRLVRSLLWTAFGGACLVLFVAGWHATAGFDPGTVGIGFLAQAGWVTTLLGGPLMPIVYLAFPFGVLSILLYLVIVRDLVRAGRWMPIASYLAIAAFVVASGVMIAMSRVQLGMAQAVASRYLTMSVWYWAALLTLVPLFPFRRIPQRVFHSLITVCLVWLSVWGAVCANALRLRMLPAYETAVSGGAMSDDVLKGIALPGTYDQARSYLQYLADNRLSAYAVTP